MDFEVVEALTLRYLGGQDCKITAAELGITPARLQSFLSRLDMPRDHDRSKFGEGYSVERARAALKREGYEIVRCSRTGAWFFRKVKDGARVTSCKEWRKRNGMVDDHERYRSQTISI
jgi:hypothetical protein